jgi:hypothetical protein
MINKNILNIFFQFIIFFVIFIIALEIIYRLLFRSHKKEIKGKKINLFGLFMELNDLTIFSIAVLTIRYLFVVYSLISNNSIIYVHLIILTVLSIVFGLSSKSIKNLFLETVSSVAIYFGLICSKLLASYLVDVRFEWYVSLGNILLILFLFIYATFFLLKNVNDLIARTKFVRRDRREGI